jgi:hypothetical protein
VLIRMSGGVGGVGLAKTRRPLPDNEDGVPRYEVERVE